MKNLKIICIFFVLILFTACAVTQNYDAVKKMVSSNDCDGAVAYIKKKKSSYGINKLLFLLDLAIVNMQCKRYEPAKTLLLKAEDLSEDLWTKSISKGAASFVTNDLIIPYAGEDFERVLINFFLAISYLELGLRDEALVECRKMDTLLSMYNNKYSEKKNAYKEDAFARYISGIIHESDSETDDAYIDYKKAYETFLDYSKHYQTKVPHILMQDIIRLADIVDRKEQVKKLIPNFKDIKIINQKLSLQKGKLVVIHLNGIAPVKIDQKFTIATISGPITIAFPEYEKKRPGCDNSGFALSVEGSGRHERLNTFLVEDIDEIAIRSLSDRKGRIWAKTLVRAIAKQVAIKKVSDHSPIPFMSSVLNTANTIALEKADTRSWQMLPAQIYMTRKFVDPGKYKVYRVDCYNQEQFEKEVTIAKGETKYVIAYTMY